MRPTRCYLICRPGRSVNSITSPNANPARRWKSIANNPLIDDIVDSGGTLCNAADALLNNGATEVYAYATHGVLSGKAVERISGSKLKSMVVTDSIEATPAMANCANIRAITIAPLLGEAMRRINNEASVSSLFD